MLYFTLQDEGLCYETHIEIEIEMDMEPIKVNIVSIVQKDSSMIVHEEHTYVYSVLLTSSILESYQKKKKLNGFKSIYKETE